MAKSALKKPKTETVVITSKSSSSGGKKRTSKGGTTGVTVEEDGEIIGDNEGNTEGGKFFDFSTLLG